MSHTFWLSAVAVIGVIWSGRTQLIGPSDPCRTARYRSIHFASCENDSMCRSPMEKCLNGYCIRDRCIVDDECHFNNSECIYGICRCQSTFREEKTGCVKVLAPPICTKYEPWSSECECLIDEVKEANGKCSPYLGSECLTSLDCSLKPNTSCIEGKCSCSPGFLLRKNQCIWAMDAGCNASTDCVFEGLECHNMSNGRFCRCPKGYAVKSFNNATCVKVYGSNCADIHLCRDPEPLGYRFTYRANTYYQYHIDYSGKAYNCDIDNRCACAPEFKINTTTNICESIYGTPCDTHLNCSHHGDRGSDYYMCNKQTQQCNCKSSSFQNSYYNGDREVYFHICTKASLSSLHCDSDQICTAMRDDLVCNSNGMCSCDDGFEENNGECMLQAGICRENVLTLPDLYRRSTSYILYSSEPPIQDVHLNNSWYNIGRFMISNAKETKELPHGACGTFYPILLIEPMSAIELQQYNTGQEIRLMAQIGGLREYGQHYNMSVQVRKCRAENLIKLQTPTVAFAAYCIDTGKQSLSGVSSTERWAYVSYDNYYSSYSCHPRDRYYKSYYFLDEFFYTIHWYVDGLYCQSYGPFQRNDLQSHTFISATVIKHKCRKRTFGFWIQCSFQWSETKYGKLSSPIFSANIRTDFNAWTVRSVEKGAFIFPYVYWTPIECPMNSYNSSEKTCLINWDITSFGECSFAATGNSSNVCGLSINRYGLTTSGHINDLDIQPISSTPFHGDLKMWKGYSIPNIQVLEKHDDVPQTLRIRYDIGMSTSVLLKTFSNGDRVVMAMLDVGQFLVFKSRKYVVELQIETETCRNPWVGSCLCGVSFRNGNEIYTNTMCHGITRQGFVYIGRGEDGQLNIEYETYIDSLKNPDIIPDIGRGQFKMEEANEITLRNGATLIMTLNFDTNSMELVISNKGHKEQFHDLDGIASFRYKQFRKRDGIFSTDEHGFVKSWSISIDDSLYNPANHVDIKFNETVYQCPCLSVKEVAGNDTISGTHLEHVLGVVKCSLQIPCQFMTDGVQWSNSNMVKDFMDMNITIVTKLTNLECLFDPIPDKKYKVQWYAGGTLILDHAVDEITPVLNPTDNFIISAESCDLDKEIRCCITVFELDGTTESLPATFSAPVMLFNVGFNETMFPKICIINHQCFFEHDDNPHDNTYACYPSIDPGKWVRNMTLPRALDDYCIPTEDHCTNIPGVAYCSRSTRLCRCAHGYKASNGQCLPFGIGSNCSSQKDCEELQLTYCDLHVSRTCVCGWGSKLCNNQCLFTDYEDTCTSGADVCRNKLVDAFCNVTTNTCACYATRSERDGKCRTIPCVLGEPTCDSISNAECRSGVCSCIIASELNITTGVCQSKGIGDSCSVDESCALVKNSTCNLENNTCVCRDTKKSVENACVPKEPGDPCVPGSNQCKEISGVAFCDLATKTCTCASTYMPANGSCIPKRCRNRQDCNAIENAYCLKEECTCLITTEINKSNGQCKPKVIGSICSADEECMHINGSICDPETPHTCICSEQFDGEDTTCILKKRGNLYLKKAKIVVSQMIEDGEHYSIFRCDYNINDGFFYKISWYLYHVKIYATKIFASSQALVSSVLKDIDMYNIDPDVFQFDAKIRCSVTAYNESGTFEIKTVNSSELIPMTISTVALIFPRGQSATFTITINVPFGCGSHSTNCRLQYLVYDPTESYNCMDSTIAVLHSDTCGGNVEGSNLTFTENLADSMHETKITITSKNNEKYYLKKDFQLVIQTYSADNHKALWQGFWTTIHVHVVDDESLTYSACHAHVDPQMQTFDNMMYENQNSGEFVLVRHKTFPIRIDMITQPCSDRAPVPTCACAVNVRAGGDVFTINHCDGHLTKYLSKLDDTLKVYRESSTQYKIILPTGMSVNIYLITRANYVMNIDIYPSPNDADQVEGMCGNFNGDPDDDLIMRDTGILWKPSSNNSDRVWYWAVYPDEFSLSWDIVGKWKESLNNPDVYGSPSLWPQNQEYCICPGVNSNNYASVCSKDEDYSCIQPLKRRGTLVTNTIIVSKDKRETQHVFPKQRLENHLKQRLERMTKSWRDKVKYLRAKRDISSPPPEMKPDEAFAYCENAFISCASVEAAKDKLNTGLNHTLEDCAFDVATTGNSQWVTAHCDSQTQAILMEIQKNETINATFPDIVAVVEKNYCPFNCSNNGKCVEGSCKCFDGYGTDLCLIQLSVPPELMEIGNNGICDTGKGDVCDCIPIVGNGFVEEAVCNVTVFEPNNSNVFIKTQTLEASCTYNDLNEVCAPVKVIKRRQKRSLDIIKATMLEIAVSNDAVHFSIPTYVVILDSTCQDIVNSHGDRVMILKDGFCYIDGRCVANNTSAEDSCKKCTPGVSTFTWTDVCPMIKRTSNEDNSNTLGIAVGIPVALLVCVGSILVGIFILKKNKKTSAINRRFEEQHVPDNQTCVHENPVYFADESVAIGGAVGQEFPE